MMTREIVTILDKYTSDEQQAGITIPDPTGALRAVTGAGQLATEICSAVGEGGSVTLRVGSSTVRVGFAVAGAATGIVFGLADLVLASLELRNGNTNKRIFRQQADVLANTYNVMTTIYGNLHHPTHQHYHLSDGHQHINVDLIYKDIVLNLEEHKNNETLLKRYQKL